MAKNGGRPSKYETYVKSRFNEINEWLKQGATEKEICKNLGINNDTWIKYKKKYNELNELVKKARVKPVEEIKAALLKRAVGFQYEEKKITTQAIKFDDPMLGEIPAKVIKTEITTKTALPDVAAGLVLLKHWDKESGWTTDPQSLELKKKELELKEKKLEEESWC